MKFSLSDYTEGVCSRDEWIKQHNPITLEVGKTYISRKGTWEETHYKILFNDGYICTAVKVYDAIYKRHGQTKDYDLFYTENGFKYGDIVRPFYRLTEERKL